MNTLSAVVGRWTVVLAGVALLLGGCGGGGGGGGGGAAPGPTAMQIAYDRTAVSLTAQESSVPGAGAEIVRATATGGSATEALYVGAELQGMGVVTPIAVSIDTVARTAQITLVPNTALAPGTYTGTVRLLACKDPQCAAHHVGSPYSLGYTTVITPRFKASAASLDFAAPETARPAAQVLRVTLPQGVTTSTAAIEYGSGATSWLQVEPQGSDYTVQPQGSLAVGTYSAVLRLEAGSAHPVLRIPVQMRVSAGLVLAAGQDLTLDSRSAPASTAGEVPVQVAAGVSATAWAASTDSPWLRLAATGGSVGTPVRWSVDPTAFAALTNESLHEAVVTVSVPGTALAPQSWRLRLTKDVAELRSADTLAVLAGEAGEVLLFGRRLDQLAQPAAQLSSPGVVPLEVTVHSPSVMGVQVPALAAGAYELSLRTASGLPTRAVRLVVAAPQEHAQTWIDSTGLKGAMVWDAVEQAAFVVDLARSAIVRIRPETTGSGPSLATTLSTASRVLPELSGIALAPDRRAVLATLRNGQMLELSPTDLRTLATRDFGRLLGPQWPQHLPLMVTGDQFLLATGGDQWAAVLAQDLARGVPIPLSPTAFVFHSGPWGMVSPNGRRLLATQTASISPRQPLVRRDGADLELRLYPAASSPEFFYHVATDRRGTRWLLDSQVVVDHDLNVLGRLPAPLPSPWIAITAAMSRDGTRAYVFAINETVSSSRIFVFDTAGAVGGAATYPLLGVIDPWLSPSCLSPTTSDTCNGYLGRMVLTDDDRTLLLAGDRRIGLVPVPAALRGGTPPARPARAPHALLPAAR